MLAASARLLINRAMRAPASSSAQYTARRNAICLREPAEVTVDEAKKRLAEREEEEHVLVEKLRNCEEVRERLEDDNELLRNSSKTFGDLAERLQDKLSSDEE
jgi:hypothetical protein